MTDHAKRMYIEAIRRINDADVLARSVRSQSDSASIIRIIGFEILLKCAIHLSGQKPSNSHNYVKLWAALPGKAQEEILEVANNRMPGHADLSNLDKLFKWYRVVFENARYFYEFYEDYTLEEQKEIGEFWVDIGAPNEDADIQYFPNELVCLIYGLQSYIEPKILKK
jgi:hypothetical protein